ATVKESPAESEAKRDFWPARRQQLKALPLPGLLAWPGGQKPFLFAPFVLAVGDRSLSPVALAHGGFAHAATFVDELPSNTTIAAGCCATEKPALRATSPAAVIETPNSLYMEIASRVSPAARSILHGTTLGLNSASTLAVPLLGLVRKLSITWIQTLPLNTDSAPACTARSSARRYSPTACRRAVSASRRSWRGAAARPSRRAPSAAHRPSSRTCLDSCRARPARSSGW